MDPKDWRLAKGLRPLDLAEGFFQGERHIVRQRPRSRGIVLTIHHYVTSTQERRRRPAPHGNRRAESRSWVVTEP